MSAEDLRQAERGFTLLLRGKQFPTTFIRENTRDLLGQAQSEYAVRLAEGRPAKNPAGWLIVCAWRRTVNLLDAQRRNPPPTSLDAASGLSDNTAPTPEEKAIDRERQGKVRRAMTCLPERDRKLVALVYFEGFSVRAAGRALGWGKSAANRHHREALGRLRRIFGNRDLLGPIRNPRRSDGA